MSSDRGIGARWHAVLEPAPGGASRLRAALRTRRRPRITGVRLAVVSLAPVLALAVVAMFIVLPDRTRLPDLRSGRESASTLQYQVPLSDDRVSMYVLHSVTRAQGAKADAGN